MKKIEKIVLLITVVIYLLAFIDFGSYEGLYNVIFYTIHLVWMFIYGMLGYRVLKLHGDYIYLSMIGGFSFAMAIFAFLIAFYSVEVDGLRMLVFLGPNYVIAIGISIVLLIGKLFSKDFQFLKPIWCRSLILALFVTFFIYTPRYSKVYTKTMLALHNGNKPLWYNLKALDYMVAYEKFRDDGKVDKAIEAAEIGVEYALKWVNLGHENFFTEFKTRAQVLLLEDYESNTIKEDFSWLLGDEDFNKFRGAIEQLMDAYLAKAESEMDVNNYEEAISFLNRTFVLSEILKNESEGWNLHMISVFWKLAISSMRLNELENAEYFNSLTSELIAKTETEKQFYVGDFLMNIAELAVKRQEYDAAIKFLEEALNYFEVDPQNKNYKKYKVLTYTDLAQNYMLTDGIEEAEHYLQLALELYDEKQNNADIAHMYPKVVLNQALLRYLKQDYYGCKEILERNFNLIPEGSFEYITFNMLFHFYIAQCNYVLSEYEASEKSLKEALEYANKGESVRSELILLSANLNFAVGNYDKAATLFQEVSVLYEQTNNESGFIPLYMHLANFYVKLIDYSKAEEYLEESTSLSKEEGYMVVARNLEFYNTMAYVNYHLGNYQKADSIYSEVIHYNESKGEPNAASSGSAKNGLGLVKMDTRKHEEAERLFKESIESYKLNFEGKHAHLGTVYLNYAIVMIKTNQLEKASQLLSDSNAVFSAFYKPTHDLFGDLYYEYGVLYEKKNDAILAKQFFQKALRIYTDAFGENNLKVKLIKQKL
ncbi:tetratricopeptide repeat protein [Myroides guanonis]|uniref:Tetratricopeptide repeat-containing protein n=1 Tax=Myroides guanonis TaxID=1150112 RepID=A0A1I3R3T8_9FLAO|nr:tetratricopeptide repeat protein [Myroides guanonis]SFJ39916.1 Tetratricopeptide repeat-containing protein [Myroides guanonis]